MAKDTSTSLRKKNEKVTIKRKWRHAKKKKSLSKNSKNYTKSYSGQGR